MYSISNRLGISLLMFDFFAKFAIQRKTNKNEHTAEPLSGRHGIFEYYNRAEYGEKFSRRRYDRTLERAKRCYSCEYKMLFRLNTIQN